MKSYIALCTAMCFLFYSCSNQSQQNESFEGSGADYSPVEAIEENEEEEDDVKEEYEEEEDEKEEYEEEVEEEEEDLDDYEDEDEIAQRVIDSFKEKGDSPKDVTPENWEIISKATGDLNQDGYDDLAFFCRKNTSKQEDKEKNYHNIYFAIYWGDRDDVFTKYRVYAGLVSPQDVCLSYEDLDVSISDRHILTMYVRIFLACGSWTNPNFSVKYRFQDGKFYRIGYDSQTFHRATGEGSDVSINYLTKKMKSTSFNAFENENRETTWSDWNSPLRELGDGELDYDF